MKRSFCFLMSFLFLISLCACAKSADDFEAPATFYYVSDPIESTVFVSEIRETAMYRQNALEILNSYFQGPETVGLVSPFPSGCTALSLVREENTIRVTVNSVFASLSGIDLSVACSSVAMTLMELTGCETVEIRSEDGPLDGVNTIVLSFDDLYIFDDATNPEV